MKRPVYLIGASVPPGNRIKSFYKPDDQGALFLLKSTNRNRFRNGSFDIAIPDEPKDGPENSLQLQWEDRKLLRLYQDGTLLFRAAADEEFLGWGASQEEFLQRPRINPVAMVELNTSFVNFYKLIVDRLKKQPEEIKIKLCIKNSVVNNKRLFITEYFETEFKSIFNPEIFPIANDPAETEIEVSPQTVQSNPNRAAFLVVKAFVDMFDLPEAKIHFIKKGPEGPEIDLETIRHLR